MNLLTVRPALEVIEMECRRGSAGDFKTMLAVLALFAVGAFMVWWPKSEKRRELTRVVGGIMVVTGIVVFVVQLFQLVFR